jgi:hypothetical protein
MAAYIIGMQKIVSLASQKENELLHQGLSPMELSSAADR